MHRDQRAERRLAALDLLAGERLGDEVEAGAAVLLGDHDAEDPELRHALDQLHVELVVDVVLDRDGQDPLVDEGANRLLDQALLVGELEVHGGNISDVKTAVVLFTRDLRVRTVVEVKRRARPTILKRLGATPSGGARS